MSIRWRDSKPIIELYDPILKRKVHVKARDHGMTVPPADASRVTLERWAARLERAALNARDTRRPGTGDETVDSFAARWPADYPGLHGRGESTRRHNAERVKAFAAENQGRTLRSIQRGEARAWANGHPGTLPALRAMFNDAAIDGLVEDNPFARLGFKKPTGREDITVLTEPELGTLTRLAEQVHGEQFGREIAALIVWSAYTCMRPGETFAARHSLLDGDVYHLQAQYNSRLRRETAPKHDGAGAIYVPEPARQAIANKPRRLGDDLIFRSKRGKQLNAGSLHRAWTPVRAAFMVTLPAGHHLHQRLALDPGDHLDVYELRHFGASHMLNALGIEPWVVARQLRHQDDGGLVLRLYGHPTRDTALAKMRQAFKPRATPLRGTGQTGQRQARGSNGG